MSEWERARLNEVIALDVDAVPVTTTATYDIVGVLNRGRGLLFRDPIAGDETSYKTLNRIRPNQIVYSRLKAFEGAITVAPNDLGEAYASQEFPTFTCGERMLPEFFRLLTTTKRFWEQLQALSTGMGGRRERVKPADFLTIEVARPSLSEQRRIVDVMAAVDAQLEALGEEGARADILWWAIASDMIDALADGDWVRLDSIADISGGLTKNKKDFERPDLVEVPYLRVANVHRRYLDLREVVTIETTSSKAAALRLQPGDILFNEGGDKDKLGRGDVWRGQIDQCIHQNHVFRARVTDPGFVPQFVSAWGNSFGKSWFETYGTQTTGIASINKRTLSRFPVPDVPSSEQKAWAGRLDAVWQTQAAVSAELAHLRTFRSNLLTSLLNQEIEIPESYDVLLEEAS
ncbi:hypothetical protein ACFQ8O_02615 [Streptomyces coelicoflavus]|uniref:restriction endonuclease subunit S n=1 Tax=Streptomyces coelicoflavus TaxID=285562 RepID=UPI0036A0B83F